jgi:hypothetical protein
VSIFILVVLGTFGLCLGIAYFGYFGNSKTICFQTPFPTNADVERYAYFKFPSTAENIEYYANGVNRKAGCTIWAKFEMDSKEMNVFQSTTYVTNFSSTRLVGNGFDYFSQSQEWQQPTSSLAGHGNPPAGASGFFTVYEDQWIFIDTSNPQTWIVYIIVNKEWL